MTDDKLVANQAEILLAALEWLRATDASRAAREEFKNLKHGDITALWNVREEATKRMEDAVRVLQGAVRDIPNQEHPVDQRIVRLRQENEQLRDKVAHLRREISDKDQISFLRNRQLDALHLVWCSGGCHGGVHRYCGGPETVTEEIVATAEKNTSRLRSWFQNYQAKKARS